MGKSLLLYTAPKRKLSKLVNNLLVVGNAVIAPSAQARNLGVTFDTELSMVPQVHAICKSAFFHLSLIGRIRKYLDLKSTKSMHSLWVESTTLTLSSSASRKLFEGNCNVSEIRRLDLSLAQENMIVSQLEESALASCWATCRLQDCAIDFPLPKWYCPTLLVLSG